MRLHFTKSYTIHSVGCLVGSIPCSSSVFLCCIRSFTHSLTKCIRLVCVCEYVWFDSASIHSLPVFCFARKSQWICICVHKSVWASLDLLCFFIFCYFANRSETRTKKFWEGTNEKKIEEQSDASTCEANQQNIEELLLPFFDGHQSKNGTKIPTNWEKCVCAYY